MSLLCLPNEVIINGVLSHLYPSDLDVCKKTELKNIIEENEEYILGVCQHIQPHGEYKLYDNDGVVHKNYKDGKKHGEHKRWYLNGQLQYQTCYIDGIENGECKVWYADGKLKHHIYYKDGEEYKRFNYVKE